MSLVRPGVVELRRSLPSNESSSVLAGLAIPPDWGQELVGDGLESPRFRPLRKLRVHHAVARSWAPSPPSPLTLEESSVSTSLASRALRSLRMVLHLSTSLSVVVTTRRGSPLRH